MYKKITFFVCGLAFIFSSVVNADHISLYDASLNSDMPQVQSDYLGKSTPALEGTYTHMTQGADTFLRVETAGTENANDQRASFYVNSVDVDRSLGVNMQFRLRIVDEHNRYSHRGVFNIQFNTNDGMGVSLFFRENQIFSVDNSFLQKDVVNNFDTSGFIDYELSVNNFNFNLDANGIQILSGSLLNFETGGPYNMSAPYVAFGDRTSASSGTFDLTSMSLGGDGITSLIMPVNIVPEPLSIILFISAVCGVYFKRNRK